ncbi:MAG: hypothetical protein CSA96_06230 [Bacteroidetes bacterium]|nr:MAG: hypothetical protein CSA96_06230 [Bacteroidota bacterium]
MVVREAGISIKASLRGEGEDRDPNSTGPATPAPVSAPEKEPGLVLEPESLSRIWASYAASMEGDARIHSTLSSCKPALRGANVIGLRLNSETQKDYFQRSVRPGLQDFLQERFGISRLFFEVEVAEDEGTEKKIYTDEDRFRFLAEMNPQLAAMKARFGLDFDQ